jgi:hypothetical protein
MSADVPPIAADNGLMDCIAANWEVAGSLTNSIGYDLIGGNRRDIGAHRRPPI